MKASDFVTHQARLRSRNINLNSLNFHGEFFAIFPFDERTYRCADASAALQRTQPERGGRTSEATINTPNCRLTWENIHSFRFFEAEGENNDFVLVAELCFCLRGPKKGDVVKRAKFCVFQGV